MLSQDVVKAFCFKTPEPWESSEEKQSSLVRDGQCHTVLSSPSKKNTSLTYCHPGFEQDATVTSAGIVHAFIQGKKIMFILFGEIKKRLRGYPGV